MKNLKDFWDIFDKIYCINLENRKDKYLHCQKFFKKLKIPVEFYKVKAHPINREQGCFESHINLIKNAYNNGYEKIIIFEDDLQLGKIKKNGKIDFQKLNEIKNFLNTNQYWDLFYLGVFILPFTIPKKESKNIFKVDSTGAHAYILNKKYMSKIKDLKYENIPIDKLFNKTARCYSIIPSLFYQGGFSSDIKGGIYNKGIINKIREHIIEPYKHNVMPFNEYILFNWLEIIYIILLIFLLFLIFYFKKK